MTLQLGIILLTFDRHLVLVSAMYFPLQTSIFDTNPLVPNLHLVPEKVSQMFLSYLLYKTRPIVIKVGAQYSE